MEPGPFRGCTWRSRTSTPPGNFVNRGGDVSEVEAQPKLPGSRTCRRGWCPPRRTVTTAALPLCNRSMRRLGFGAACAWAWRASYTRTRAHFAAVQRSGHDGVGPPSRPGVRDAGVLSHHQRIDHDFGRPFAMHLPRNEVASGRPLQMQVRHLQFRTGQKTLPARQLWALSSETELAKPRSSGLSERVAPFPGAAPRASPNWDRHRV
jgi:hypothetical protein